MSGRREEAPSPLAGEDAARSAAGEGLGGAVIRVGVGSREPSPDLSLRSRSSSPVKGEGTGVRRTRNAPSPLAGEDAAGLGGAVIRGGMGSREPSPDRSLRSRSSSPVKGEGKDSLRAVKVPMLRHRARALRVRMTSAERKLWYALRDRRFAGFKFRRQVPIGHFIVDFVCFEARLVIELDGGQHADSMRDRRRDRWFAANNFRVLRFWNNDVLANREGVMMVLAQALRVEWS